MVAVVTYRRPVALARLLDSLVGQLRPEDRLLVVDNDPAGSARDTAARAAVDCEYVVEPAPGIAAARNAVLDHVADTAWSVAFVDDDETVQPRWLASLVASSLQHQAAVVCGPVTSVFEERCPAWVRRSRFFDRPRQRSGTKPRWPATNNCLVRVASVGDLRFDEAFSLTGGSDSRFFQRLAATGARLVWCDEAGVVEHVPPGRATLAWMYRRGRRLGNVSARMKVDVPAPVLAGVGLVRALVYAPLAALHVAGLPLPGSPLLHVTKGIGMVEASAGRLVQEYGR